MRTLKPCGTQAAYYRHRRYGEPPCDDCRRAAAKYEAERRRRQGRPSRASWKPPRCGTTAGYQHHRRTGTRPCDPCVEAWNEYHSQRRRGTMIHRRHDTLRAPDLIADVLETYGYPMTTGVLVSHVLDIRPDWNEASVTRALVRMVADGRAVRFERLGETYNDIPPR